MNLQTADEAKAAQAKPNGDQQDGDRAAYIRQLIEKGDGVIIRYPAGVWSYPGAEIDRSGTNLRLPLEHVSDNEVREALQKGGFVAKTMDAVGQPVAVATAGEGTPARAITLAQAGSVDAATELPENSRPSIDAGYRPPSPAEVDGVATAAANAARAALAPPPAPQPEGKRGR